MFRLCYIVLIFLPAFAFGNDLLDYLQGYEGRWFGDYSIHSTANGYTEKFTVEQRYWWKDKVLHGLAVYERDGKMVTATSKTWLDGKKLISEVQRDKAKEIYYGVLHDGGLLWIFSDMRRANDYQMREVLTEKEGSPRKMKIEGFDTYVTGDDLVHLIYKGELTLQAEEK